MNDRGALTCPSCQSGKTRVYETKHENATKTIRRHACDGCNQPFRTVQEHAVSVGWVRESQA